MLGHHLFQPASPTGKMPCHCSTVFKKHACYNNAVDVMIPIPATTRDIGEQLSQLHYQENATNRRMFLKILSSIRYLARQGLPLRGDSDEQNGNFLQLDS